MVDRLLRTWQSLLLGGLLLATSAQGHLIDAQHGTLNFVGEGAFLVLSVPVSAFRGVDDDGDGALSLAEMRAHQVRITAEIEKGVQLSDAEGARPLEGVMLTLSPEHHATTSAARHLVVMGRFALKDPARPLDFQVLLFGQKPSERRFDVTVTRGEETQQFSISPEKRKQALLR